MNKRPCPSVIDISFPRTGTRSLCVAFRQLGWTATHGPSGLTQQRIMREEIARGTVRFSLLAKYQYVGHMGPWWEDLAEEYPEARFILLTRDEEDWRKSVRRHLRKRPERRNASREGIYDAGLLSRLLTLGATHYSQDLMLRRYRRHNRLVCEYFAWKSNTKQRFLHMQICHGEGWEKLCNWLGVEAPDREFPWRFHGGTHGPQIKTKTKS